MQDVADQALDARRLALEARSLQNLGRRLQQPHRILQLAGRHRGVTRLAQQPPLHLWFASQLGRMLEVAACLGAERQRDRAFAGLLERLARPRADRLGVLGLRVGFDGVEIVAREHLRDVTRLLAPRLLAGARRPPDALPCGRGATAC